MWGGTGAFLWKTNSDQNICTYDWSFYSLKFISKIEDEHFCHFSFFLSRWGFFLPGWRLVFSTIPVYCIIAPPTPAQYSAVTPPYREYVCTQYTDTQTCTYVPALVQQLWQSAAAVGSPPVQLPLGRQALWKAEGVGPLLSMPFFSLRGQAQSAT